MAAAQENKPEATQGAIMTYFKPFRRKIGLLTLMMACVFMAGWGRSDKITDFVAVCDLNGTISVVESSESEISFYRTLDPPPLNSPLIWADSRNRHNSRIPILDPLEGETFPSGWAIPYWSIVLPLTLLSAYLLLSKSRTTPATTIDRCREI